ncbi:MAG TPA: translocation/assembly module TamB domain-containing protein, partial [Methylophilus sp.]
GFAGKVNASGDIIQQIGYQQYRYELAAQALTLPNNTGIDDLNAKGEFSSADNGLLNNQVSIKGLRWNETDDSIDSKAINATLALTGTLQQHALTLAVKNADPADAQFGLNSRLEGALNVSGWQGKLTQLDSLDQATIKLLQPATMSFSPQAGFNLQNMRLQIQQTQSQAGLLALESFSYVPAATAMSKPVLKSNGRLQALPLQVLQDYLALSDPQMNNQQVNNTLALDGEWRVEMAEQINAAMTLRRASGDLVIQPAGSGATGTPLGLQTLAADLNIVNNQIQANTTIVSTYAGKAQANFTSSITSTRTGFALNRQTPFTLTADANLLHLNWLSMNEMFKDIALDGQLALSLKANGVLDAPQIVGDIRGEKLQIQIPSEGVLLQNGILNTAFNGNKLLVKQLDFAGKSGTLNTTGEATILTSPPHLKLNIVANKFTALSRTDRFIVLSGQGDINMDDRHVLIGGDFKILNGLFELPKAGKPTLDDDVVIVGQSTEQVRNPLPIILGGLTLDFGKKETPPFKEDQQFLVRGMGVNGALSGQIKLAGNVRQLNAYGMLEVNGTYYSYGQLLAIETGQVSFSGPISNAGLNIVAMRDLEPTKVGIKLSGELKAPRVSLVSEPENSDNDKLSMLVLGRPMSEAGSSELALLSVAAGALLSQGDSVPLQSRIAGIVGLDNIDVKGSSASNYSVTVGKRINRRLVIGYEKSLFGLLNVAKLTYQLTRRIAIETTAGSDNALDVIYSLDFD